MYYSTLLVYRMNGGKARKSLLYNFKFDQSVHEIDSKLFDGEILVQKKN